MRNTMSVGTLISNLNHNLEEMESKVDNYANHIFRLRTLIKEVTVGLKQSSESNDIHAVVNDMVGRLSELPDLPYDLRRDYR